MSKEYRAKVFRSGNSVALRLPKVLGLHDGDEMILREEAGKFEFEPAPPARTTIDVDTFWGKAAGLHLLTSDEREFETRPSERQGGH